MKLLLSALMLFILGCASLSKQQTQGSWDQYHNEDRFQWTVYDNDVHLLLGYGISFTTAEALSTWTNLTPFESSLIGFTAAGMIGTAKEVFHDAYTSRTDIKCWWGGALVGMLTFTIIRW